MPVTINTDKVKTEQHLRQIVVKYENADFIGDQLAPVIKVKKESDKFRKYKKDGYFSGAPIRSDGAPAEEMSLAYDEDTYSTRERAGKDIVTNRAINNADSVFNLKADVSKFLATKVRLSREIDIADALLASTGGISSSAPDHVVPLSGGDRWDDQTNSDPESNIAVGKEAVMKQIGRKPNVIMISGQVERHLATHPKIKELRKYVTTEALTKGGIPSTLFDLRVIVAPAVYNSAAEGETVTMEWVWGKKVLIAYVNPADPITLARNFVLSSGNFIVRSWYDEERKGTWIEVSDNYRPKVIVPEAGYLLETVIS